MPTHQRHLSLPDCIFCKIVAGIIPSRKIYSDHECIVFLDINPVNKGHLLVVPRYHHRDLTDLPSDTCSHIASKLHELAKALVKATKAEGFNVIINNGAVAGQTIFHGHWHIIPRFHDDPVNWPWPHGSYFGDEINQMAFAIERELAHKPDTD